MLEGFLFSVPQAFDIENIHSVLFEQEGAKKNIFAAQIKTANRNFARCDERRGLCQLSIRCWISQKSSIRVASLTLERVTTFTRHHAFLKRFDPNFHNEILRYMKIPAFFALQMHKYMV